MDHLTKVTAHVKEVIQKDVPHVDMIAGHLVSGFAYDVAMVCKNIRETSISMEDKRDRVRLLAEQTGMELLQIIQLCQ